MKIYHIVATSLTFQNYQIVHYGDVQDQQLLFRMLGGVRILLSIIRFSGEGKARSASAVH